MEFTQKELISHHVFLLPFKWAKPSKDNNNIEEHLKTLGKELGNFGWKSDAFLIDQVAHYNEFSYFYDYVRDVLYETGASQQAKHQYIRHFHFPKAEKGVFSITTPIPKAQRDADKPYDDGADNPELRKTYLLEIDSVLLHLYDTGVGMLSFHLNNREETQAAPEDVLYINQYGRRVFPSFYPIAPEKAGRDALFEYHFEGLDNGGKAQPNGKELAYDIGIQFGDTAKVENWTTHPSARLKDKNAFQFQLSAFTEPFLEVFEKKGFQLHSVLDDRMFVVCWYGNDTLSRGVQCAYFDDVLMDEQAQAIQDWWYKYVFVDSEDVTVQHLGMRAKLLKEATYLRWAGYDTYYGVTDYSFVVLTGTLEHLRKPHVNASFLVTHLQTIYFRLVELTLVQRACVQRFSDDIARISRLDEGQENKLSQEANALYRRYLRFLNRVYFREVTAQVQGIELYDLLHKQSRIRPSVESLNAEIQELNTYVQQVHDGQKAEKLNTLSMIGSLLAGPGLLFTFTGLAGLPGDDEACSGSAYWWLAGAALVCGGLFYCSYRAYTKSKTGWVITFVVAALGIVMALPPILKSQLPACASPATEATSKTDSPATLPAAPVDTLLQDTITTNR